MAYDLTQLVGRVLRSATISRSRPVEEGDDPTARGDDVLTFETDAAPVVWDVEGDCCSESRFTDLKLDAVLGKRIVIVARVEAMTDPALDPATLRKFFYPEYDYKSGTSPDVPSGAEKAPQESEQIYGVRLVAEDAAVGFVIYRNWSNGYYGAMLEERDVVGETI